MSGRSHVTSHVLDATLGRPAAGVGIRLEALQDGAWSTVATGTTDRDGRVSDLGPERLDAGVYRVAFDTGAYFGDRRLPCADLVRAGRVLEPAGERFLARRRCGNRQQLKE